MQGIIGKRLKRHHMVHHHKNPYSCYGVTIPLWDKVFGTLQR